MVISSKKGAEKYYIIISLILGLIILALALFFIFQEYFTGEEIDWETCRQSVILRETIPRQDAFFQDIAAAREAFPLKCKTEVVNINYKNTTKLGREILETMRSCWALFDDGKGEFFPVDKFSGHSFCLPCARIHLESSVVDYYKEEANQVNFTQAFKQKVPDTQIGYLDYFQRKNEGFSAFAYVADEPWAETFTMKAFDKTISHKTFDFIEGFFIPSYFGGGQSSKTIRMQLPDRWNVEDSSDLLIIVYQTVYSFEKEDPKYQSGQVHMAFMTADRISETQKSGFWGIRNIGRMCENWEGIPA